MPDPAPEAQRPEVELLLACARTHATPAERERIRSLARGPVDWPTAERLADAHGLLPLLAQRLETHASREVPPAVRARLRQQMLARSARCLVLTRALVDLLIMLTTRGVPALPYKGPALAAMAYGSPVLRQPGDLDVLVPGDQLAAARAVLEELGYRDVGPDARPAHYQHAMIRDGDAVLVELHWAFAPRYFRFPLDPRVLGREPILLDGCMVDTIAPGDLLVALCVHGARHLWSRLGWIADVAELLRARPEVDWADTLARATALGARRMLLVGLALARDTLGAELPEPLARALAADRTAFRVARWLRAGLFRADAGKPGLATAARLHLAMRERWRDRAAYLLGAVTPSERDARGTGVLRALTRPARLIRDHGIWRGRPRV